MEETIGQRVAHCLEAKGWSQAHLAKKSTLGQSHIWNIINGIRTRVEAETLKRLAVALDVSADYLLGLRDTPTPLPRRVSRRRTSIRAAQEVP